VRDSATTPVEKFESSASLRALADAFALARGISSPSHCFDFAISLHFIFVLDIPFPSLN